MGEIVYVVSCALPVCAHLINILVEYLTVFVVGVVFAVQCAEKDSRDKSRFNLKTGIGLKVAEEST